MSLVMGANRSRGATFVVGGGCVPIEGARTDMIQRSGCAALRDAGFQMATQKRFDTVVIGGSWNRLFTDDQNMNYFDDHGKKVYFDTETGRRLAFARLTQQIVRFRTAGKRVFLVLDAAIAREFSPRGLKTRLSLSATNFTPDLFVSVRPAQLELREQMLTLAHQSGAIAVDPFPAHCQADKCRATNDTGLPIYKDAGHFNPDWVRDHANFIDPTVQP
jgi:hypothetical protein